MRVIAVIVGMMGPLLLGGCDPVTTRAARGGCIPVVKYSSEFLAKAAKQQGELAGTPLAAMVTDYGKTRDAIRALCPPN